MRRWKYFSLMICFILSTGSFTAPTRASHSPSPASNTPWLGLADTVPPAMTTIAMQRTTAYVGAGHSLLAFDISDPDNPQRIHYQLLPDAARRVIATEDRVFVLVGIGKIMIFDTSRLPDLRWIGEYQAARIDGFTVDSNRLFVGNQDGFLILDARDTRNLQVIGQILLQSPPGTSIQISEIRITGNLAVLGLVSINLPFMPAISLWIADITDPANPVKIGELSLPAGHFEYITDLEITTDLAILAAEYESDVFLENSIYYSIDITEPISPTLLTFQSTGVDGAFSIALADPYLFTGSFIQPIKIFDLSNPAAPQMIGSQDERVWDLAVEQDLLLTVGDSGLSVYNRLGSGGLAQRGAIVGIGSAEDLDIQGGLLAIADGGSDGRSVGISYLNGGLVAGTVQPDGHVDLASKLATPKHGTFLKLVGSEAWLIGGTCKVDRYDRWCDWHLYNTELTNPALPVLLSDTLLIDANYATAGPLAIDHEIASIPIYGDLYDNNGLAVLDISPPMTPTLLSTYPSPTMLQAGVITGTFGLVTDQDALLVLDASDPYSLTLQTSYPMNAPGRIVVQGSLGFVAATDPQSASPILHVLDLAQLPQVQILASIATKAPMLDAAYNGGILYVAEGEAGLQVFDLADPSQPQEIFAYDSPGKAVGVAVENGLVYLADQSGGVFIFNKVYPQVYLPWIGFTP